MSRIGAKPGADVPKPSFSGKLVNVAPDKTDDDFVASIANEYKLDMSEMQALANMFAYDGFDPVAFQRKFILHLRKMYERTPDPVVSVRRAIMRILTFGVTRGTKLRSTDKVKQEGMAMLAELAEMGVNLSPAFGPQSADVITVQRIMACFPYEVSILVGTGKTRVIGDADPSLPVSLRHPNAPALFPSMFGMESSLFKVWAEWSNSFAKIVTQSLPTEDKKQEAMKKQPQFHAIVFRSNIYDDKERIMRLKAVLNQERTQASSLIKSSIDAILADMGK